jgi:hypothetical protein
MRYPDLARTVRGAAAVALVAGLAGCAGSLSGAYADESGLLKFTFKPGHKVEIHNPLGFGNVEYEYEIKDKALRIEMPEGTQVFPFVEKGCFQVSVFGKVCKVKS